MDDAERGRNDRDNHSWRDGGNERPNRSSDRGGNGGSSARQPRRENPSPNSANSRNSQSGSGRSNDGAPRNSARDRGGYAPRDGADDRGRDRPYRPRDGAQRGAPRNSGASRDGGRSYPARDGGDARGGRDNSRGYAPRNGGDNRGGHGGERNYRPRDAENRDRGSRDTQGRGYGPRDNSGSRGGNGHSYAPRDGGSSREGGRSYPARDGNAGRDGGRGYAPRDRTDGRSGGNSYGASRSGSENRGYGGKSYSGDGARNAGGRSYGTRDSGRGKPIGVDGRSGGHDRPRRDNAARSRGEVQRRERWENPNRPSENLPVRARHNDPEIPDEVEPKDLDKGARAELKTLTKENSDFVARHLVMAGMLIDENPELAHQHALSAARKGGRVGIVRETVGLTAYATGDFTLALRELRTFRRITGLNDQVPVMVDCERGLGRPKEALELGRSVDRSTLDSETQVELAIAMSGARLDLGDDEQALVELEIPQLDKNTAFRYSPHLYRAYAEVLTGLGRNDEAADWIARAEVAEEAFGIDEDGFPLSDDDDLDIEIVELIDEEEEDEPDNEIGEDQAEGHEGQTESPIESTDDEGGTLP